MKHHTDELWPLSLAICLIGLALGFGLGYALDSAHSEEAAVLSEPPAAVDPLPADPCQRLATKALRGDYGKLNARQRKAYELLLAQGLTEADISLALATAYGPWEGYDYGEGTAYGYGCSDLTLAANAIPAHWYVLLERRPGQWQVRQIQDTGASWNDRHWRAYARRHFRVKAECWVDLFLPHDINPQPMRMLKVRAQKTW